MDSKGVEGTKACATTTTAAAAAGETGKPTSTVGASGAGESTGPGAGESGLGTGGITGIAVGGVAVVRLLGAAAFWLMKRRKAKAAAATGPHEGEWDPHHVYYHEAGGLPKFVAHEVGAERPAVEMAATPSVQYVPPRQSGNVWHELA